MHLNIIRTEIKSRYVRSVPRIIAYMTLNFLRLFAVRTAVTLHISILYKTELLRTAL
jgi:hypothetical protein